MEAAAKPPGTHAPSPVWHRRPCLHVRHDHNTCSPVYMAACICMTDPYRAFEEARKPRTVYDLFRCVRELQMHLCWWRCRARARAATMPARSRPPPWRPPQRPGRHRCTLPRARQAGPVVAPRPCSHSLDGECKDTIARFCTGRRTCSLRCLSTNTSPFDLINHASRERWKRGTQAL